MNIFNGRPWFDHAALCCKESLNKIFDKKINPKKIYFGEIFFEKQPKINPVILGWVKFSNSGFGWVWVLKFRVRFGLGFLKKPGFRVGFR
jgi:hypothetical protein